MVISLKVNCKRSIAAVLNYGQGLFEGLKAYRKQDGNILLCTSRMRNGAERLCMPAPTLEPFVEAVKETVLANKRLIPHSGKGSLYIRPLLMGTGAVLAPSPAPEYTFLVYVSPVGNYFQDISRKFSYGEDCFGAVSRQLYTILTSLQMVLSEDNMN